MAGLLEGNEIWLVPPSGPEIPIEFIAAIDFQMSRGTDHDSVKFLTSDDRFNNVGAGPCKFRFKTPERFGGGVKQFEWKGWYMASIQPNSARPGTFIVTLHDERWVAAKNKVTVGYNIDWPDTKARSETKTSAGGAGEDWTCVKAAQDALARFGLTVDGDLKTLTAEQVKKVLPHNLGNSPGGGWTAASFGELIPALLEPIRCDIIMTPENKVRIVSRSGYDDSPKLEAHGLISGVVGERNIKWQLPRYINVKFERLAEGAFELTPARDSQTSAVGAGLNWWVENVMPSYNNGQPNGEYGVLEDEVQAALGTPYQSENYIGERWFKPHLFPYKRDYRVRSLIKSGTAAELAEAIAKRSWFDDMVRQCWRRLYRVSPRMFSSTSYARYFTNIRLGRLEKNGGVKDGGCVYMPYVKHLRWGRLPSSATGNSPLLNILSENHHFGDPANGSPEDQYSYAPAPFTARWVSPEKLVFEVRPDRPDNINAKSFFPGTMREHLNYGPLFRLEGGAALKVTEVGGIIKGASGGRSSFYMRVIYNGRVSADMPSGFIGDAGLRMYTVEKSAFPNGMGPDVTVKAGDSVTANFVFTDDALKLPVDGRLMNQTDGLRKLANPDEVEDVAQYIADQVKQTYVQNRAGVATVEGVGAMIAGIWTGGLINHCAITVGQGMNEAIHVHYTVQPEVRDVETSRTKPEKAPRRAVEE